MAEAVSESGLVVSLTEYDVPRASLVKPTEEQSVPALKQWLLCCGVEVASSIKKKQLLELVNRFCVAKCSLIVTFTVWSLLQL